MGLAAADYDALTQRARDARLVLLGEASHGTHEFYRERAEITKRLVAEGGCRAIAVEADWPDAYRVNRYVRGRGGDASAEEALSGFRRFPSWMWRNADVAEFVGWLRAYNDGLPAAEQIGFYGLDLYSIYASMDEVVGILEQIDPPAADRARARYACFGHYGRDPQVYAYETGLGGVESCERQAIAQLLELREDTAAAALAGALDEDRRFYAEMNALLVVDAEAHFRAVFRGGQESWNLRDRHMVRTLAALLQHLGRGGAPARAVVWAHNSHVGDARATDMCELGQVTLGQLVRELFGAQETFIAGFTTYGGTVTAASDWGGPAERMGVRPALAGSWEELLHEQGRTELVVDTAALEGTGLERAIGVVYRPETERLSHYFHARLEDQFDAVIHLDETRAVEPLERTSAWDAAGELPGTYPSGA
jgi:erythromycin esterase-like protein